MILLLDRIKSVTLVNSKLVASCLLGFFSECYSVTVLSLSLFQKYQLLYVLAEGHFDM